MPQALLIGVDYHLFWELNPRKLKPFEKAFEERLKIQNHQAWVQGIYMKSAVASVLNGSKAKYFEKPIDLYGEENHDTKIENMVSRFAANAMLFNHSFKNKGVEA